MAGLKTYLETLRDQGVIDTATQTSFNEFALKQISDLYSNINGEDPSWLDKIISTYEKIVKVIKIVKEIYEWLSHLLPLHAAQMQYNYNSNDPTEVLCAIEEAVNNNYFTINFYTKAEVDALLQNANVDTSVFVRNDRVQNLSNAFHFSNVNNTITCALIAPQDIEIGLQHLNMVITAGLVDNTVIPTQGYVDTQDRAIISLFNSYYTKTEIDNMLPNMTNYYTKTEVDALIPNMSNYYTKTEVDALIPDISICVKNNSVQNLSNQFNFSNVANTWVGNTLVTNSITMGNYTLSSIVTVGIVNNNVIPSQGYVDTKITSELANALSNYYNKGDVDNLLNNYYDKGDVDNIFNNSQNSQTWNNQISMTNPLNSIAAGLLTLGGVALGAIVTGGSSNNDKGVTQGYVDNKISTELSNYYTKSEVDALLTPVSPLLTTLNLCYPIGSYFFYDSKITLVNNKPTSTTNTILDYFEWQLIQESANSVAPGARAVFGILTDNSGFSEGFNGLRKLAINNVPAHSHNGLISSSHHAVQGGVNAGAWVIPTIGDGVSGTAINDNIATGQNIGHLVSQTWYSDTPQQEFTPRGYYTYCYKRIA